MVLSRPLVVAIELQRVAIMALVGIGNLETFHPPGLVEVEREKVEYVVDILDAVDMTVDVDVAILDVACRNRSGGGVLHLTGTFYGTRLIANVMPPSCMESRSTGLRVSMSIMAHTERA